ncbi:GrpB family protein [Serratia marcescens]|uniref:GrpB family protein n=1 Tax=Serratia marcescens TaxID=615 RepID=UPI001F05A7DE|nr:GrpB family protein [Serratia marcescens]MDM1837869.1 GrpB family protein [Serratia marcescens]MDM1848460.1 GrpB family protein [Serratia marcescens]UMK50253.1 GrpB family protein [Serratia marcescens]
MENGSAHRNYARLLAGVLTAIHHIGCTAVPELAAKPTIDILLWRLKVWRRWIA